jgi:predicted nucleic-acid-binding protein
MHNSVKTANEILCESIRTRLADLGARVFGIDSNELIQHALKVYDENAKQFKRSLTPEQNKIVAPALKKLRSQLAGAKSLTEFEKISRSYAGEMAKLKKALQNSSD